MVYNHRYQYNSAITYPHRQNRKMSIRFSYFQRDFKISNCFNLQNMWNPLKKHLCLTNGRLTCYYSVYKLFNAVFVSILFEILICKLIKTLKTHREVLELYFRIEREEKSYFRHSVYIIFSNYVFMKYDRISELDHNVGRCMQTRGGKGWRRK